MLLLWPISGNNRLHEARSCGSGVGHPDGPFLEGEGSRPAYGWAAMEGKAESDSSTV